MINRDTYSGWEITAGFEFLQSHGAGVGAKEEDKRHEGDVRDVVAAVAHKVASIFPALLLCQRWPGDRVIVLKSKENIP